MKKSLILLLSILLMTGCSQKSNEIDGYTVGVAALAGTVFIATAPVVAPLMVGKYIGDNDVINKKYKDINSTEKILAIHGYKKPNIIYKYKELYIWVYSDLIITDSMMGQIHYDIYFLIKEDNVLSHGTDFDNIKDWKKKIIFLG